MGTELENVLSSLKEIKVEQLKRENKDYNFVDIYPLLVEIFNNLKLLENNLEFWSLVPETKQNNVLNVIKEFNNAVQRIKNFEPTSLSNPLQDRNNLANQIKSAYSTLYEILFSDLKIYTLSRQLKAKNIQHLQNQAQELLQSVTEIKKKSESAFEAIQTAAGSTGVSKFSEIFEEEAKRHKKLANIWLWVSIFSAIGIGYFLSAMFAQLIQAVRGNTDFAVSLQVFLAKILLISFFSYIFYHIIKNYNANMHLYTINKHRENSLKTFQSFVKSTDDKKVQDVILMQATKSIFEIGDTGYLSSKDKTIKDMEVVKVFDQFNRDK